jgi:tetratricopeptide (TPR) repeat protein
MGDTVTDLLDRAYTDPVGALGAAAERLVAASPSDRIELLRVMGNACRELRRVDESTVHLQAAVDEARLLGDARLEGLAAMSLAATLSYAGDFDRSLELASRAVDVLEGDERVAALSQRAGLLARAGRNEAALAAFTEALDAAADSADPMTKGDLWVNRGVLLGWAGDVVAAEDDTNRALELFARLGHAKRAADVRHNLAWLAGRRGDLVEAFRRFDEAERDYESLGLTAAAIFPDRSEALLAAGLTKEALALAERAVDALGASGDDVDLAEASMLVARAALLAGDPERATVASLTATQLFESQGRGGWWAAAAALHVEARRRAGVAGAADVERIDEVIEAAAASGLSAASVEARVVAAELAADGRDWTTLARHLDVLARVELGAAARCRVALARIRWLAATDGRTAALAACDAAVEEFGTLTAALGGTELRAHVAAHVTELVDEGLALALADHDPAAVFDWTERQRASALDSAPVRPPEDPELAADLARLRATLTELDGAARQGIRDQRLAAPIAELEDRVRRRSRHVAGAPVAGPVGGPIADALGELHDVTWVSFAAADDELTAVVVEDGTPRIAGLGPAERVLREASLLRSTLAMHLQAVGRGIERDPAVVLAAAAEADEALIGPLDLPPGPVALSPSTGLHDLPWGLLPSLRARSFALAPSLALWRRCRATPTGVPFAAVAVAGPDVPLADVEATRVLACYQRGGLLHGDQAVVADVGTAIRGADVAHLVCHGRFSSDNPMFSSLLMADGPMFVYDLERLSPPPKVIVLSACHAGSHATPAGREVLGLTASLLARGPRAVVAATVPIPDTLSTVELMGLLHERLAAGAGAADALVEVRGMDAVVGGAFACYGAA